MESIVFSIGRFHPLVVHLPIGMLVLAFILELLSVTQRFRKVRSSVQPALFFGAVFSIIATITGYSLKQEGGYDEELVETHQYLGIATTILAVTLFVIRRNLKLFYTNPVKRRRARILLFTPLIILLSATGHWGGTLTHGEAYLFEGLAVEGDDPLQSIRKIENVEQAIFFEDVIAPVLEAKCYSCHGATRQKGKLRLDSRSSIEMGGKNGPVIAPGVPDSSELYKRLVLPLEDKHHMPPKEKPQLSSTELDLITLWIAEEANYSRKVVEFPARARIVELVHSLQYTAEKSWVPEQSIEPVDPGLIANLSAQGASVMQVSRESNYLMVNLVNVPEVTPGIITSLKSAGLNVVWLNAASRAVSDSNLLSLSSEMSGVRVLYLNNSAITDASSPVVNQLKELRYLNLVNTSVSDKFLEGLENMVNLQRLFLYGTGVTAKGVADFQRRFQKVAIDTGHYRLETLPGDTVIHKPVKKGN